MTCTRNSKRVDAAIARLVFLHGRAKIRNSYLDRLIVELLGDDLSFARELLRMSVGDAGIKLLIADIEQNIQTNPVAERCSSQLFYADLCRHLRSSVNVRSLSSVHLLYYALTEPRCVTFLLAQQHNITTNSIVSTLADIELGKKQ
jgi:hypothetical protein